MKVTVEHESACRKIVSVAIEKEAIDAEYDKVLAEFASFARLPGFRPGKAPVAMVEKRFGSDILEELKNRIIPRSVRKALSDENLKPVSFLRLDDVPVARGAPLSFRVSIDVAPEFSLPVYSGISIEGKKTEVGPEQVDAFIKTLREGSAQYVETSGRPVVEGDMCCLEYEGSCGGVLMKDLPDVPPGIAAGTDQWIPADDLEILPGFGKQLVGMNIGESRNVTVDFPEGHRLAPLAGKKAEFKVGLKGIKGKELQPMDERFFKEMGVETEQELKERIKESLARRAADEEKRRVKGELVRKLLTDTEMDLPESLVAEETERSIRNFVFNSMNRGVGKDDITAQKDAILKSASDSARDRVKMNYILDAIADKENISVPDSDVMNVIRMEGAREGLSEEKLKKTMMDKEIVERVRRDLRIGCALDYVYSHANIGTA